MGVLLSGNAVKKAGNVIKKSVDPNSENQAIAVLAKWRAYHAQPLNIMRSYINKTLKKKDFIVAQRLKRMQSIILKLRRFPKMSAESMQDLGGVRIIVPSVKDVYQVLNTICVTTDKHHPKFDDDGKIITTDYIKYPKPDGYRSVHQVFDVFSEDLNKNLNIEVQIRTELQHIWSTAVETLGMLDKTSYKTGDDRQSLTARFLKIVSALFAFEEGQPIPDEFATTDRKELIDELKQLEDRLQVINKLKAIAKVEPRFVNTIRKKDNYLVLLLVLDNEGKNQLNIFPFTELDQAELIYSSLEQSTKNDALSSTVLIELKNFKNLKKAYPNYYLDTQKFIHLVEEAINAQLHV